jgi:Ca-activated chloride channel family protein
MQMTARRWGVLLALTLSACTPSPQKPDTGSAASPAAVAPAGSLEIVFTYGSEKEEWVKDVTAAFNAEKHTTASGKAIFVKAVALGSGECIDELVQGTRQAHLTSPASAAFIKLGNAQWRAKTGKDLIGATDNLLLSPVVIAMWKPMAEALGWGQKAIGWADVLALARDPKGWGAHGHPEWGAFKFGHTHPEASNSGLIALFAEVYAAAGKLRDLGTADVAKPKTAEYVAAIEKAVVHYGSSTGFFGRKMFERGPGYLSAAVLYENMVIESYSSKYQPPFPVVAIYPKEGTFWSDHPVGIVEREWVTPEHREAAKAYIQYLLAPAQQAKAVPYGFRPAAVDVPLGAPIDAAHGIDAKEPKTTLEVPSVETIDAILNLWRGNKRHANVTLVLDISGSMNSESRIQNAKAGAEQLVAALGDTDRFSLLLFNAQPRWVHEGVLLKDQRSQVVSTLQGVFADGGTALYDAVDMAYQRQLAEQPAQGDRISALVVLTDGADTDSKLTLEDLLPRIQFDGERRSIRVFTIAYGSDAKRDVLLRLSEATQAKSFDGNPQNIRSVFRDISTFF